MRDTDRIKNTQNIPCPGCGGSGQSSYFGGESRFMLTWEDCPDCCGTGIQLNEGRPAPDDDSSDKTGE